MKKKIIIFISLVLVISICSLIGTTLSRYRSQAIIKGDGDVAKWIIKVNNSEVSKNTVKTFAVNPQIIPSEDVLDGTSAPGSMSYADIEVDVSQVDVSFQMEIETYIPGNTHTHPTFKYINMGSVNESNINTPLSINSVKIGYLPYDSNNEFTSYYLSNSSREAYFNSNSYYKLNQDAANFSTYRFLYTETTPLDGYDHDDDSETINTPCKDHIVVRLYFEALADNNTRDTLSGHDAAEGTKVSDTVYVAISFKQWIHS